MNKEQETILWLGLILVGLNILVHIHDFKSVLFGGPVNPPAVNIPGTSIPNPFGGNVPSIGIPGIGNVPIPVNNTFPQQTPPPNQVTLQLWRQSSPDGISQIPRWYPYLEWRCSL